MSSDKSNYVVAGLLAVNTLLLGMVGWFSIRTVDNVEQSIKEVVQAQKDQTEEMSDLKVEFAGLKATMESWAKRELLPRSEFDAMKSEMSRRIEALEKERKQ